MLAAVIFIGLAWLLLAAPGEAQQLFSPAAPANPFGGLDVVNSSVLNAMADAVTNEEGQPGDRNYRNNNPGNLKPPNGAPNFWSGQIGVDPDCFAIFDSFADGRAALITNLSAHIAGNPEQTITDYFAAYSPDSTGLSGAYGAAIAAALGVSPDTPLGEI